MVKQTKNFLAGLSILIGTCVGAGILGIPYVIAKVGFLIGLIYLFFVGLIIIFINLYLGEIILRTKKRHQLSGYAEKYLGKKGKFFMQFAFIFGIYSAIVAYLFGVGESFSFLFFANSDYSLIISLIFSGLMSFLLFRGLKALKRFEKWGVGFILLLLFMITFIFAKDITLLNLSNLNLNYLFLPFGVILFALLSFSVIPEVSFILKDKKKLKRVLILGTLISVLFYTLFTFVVVGFKGLATPGIATLSLGPIFILLGIFTMFTSYLALGNALKDYFERDESFCKKKSWFLSAIIPIFLFLFIKLFKHFSFTDILSIGGVISGGLIAILILLMVYNAKRKGDRKPEYFIPLNWFIIILLSLIFIFGILREIVVILK